MKQKKHQSFLPICLISLCLVCTAACNRTDDNAYWLKKETERQIDIWGSAYAAEMDITTDVQLDRVSDYFFSYRDEIIRRGHVRHLPGREGWQSFFEGKEKINPLGEYQNGGYWTLPLPWVVPVVWRKDPGRARQMVNDAIEDFQANGVAEYFNEENIKKIPNYVTSATNLYAASRWISSQASKGP